MRKKKTGKLSTSLIMLFVSSTLVLGNLQTFVAPGDTYVELIVQAAPNVSSEALLKPFGGTLISELPVIQGFAAKIPKLRLPEFRKQNEIKAIAYNHPVRLMGNPERTKIGEGNTFNRPEILRNIYQQMVNVNTVRETGKGVHIAVLDSGIGLSKFSKDKVQLEHSYAVNPWATTTDDRYGHGTHIAGIINGQGKQDLRGIAPGADIVNVKLGDDQGNVTEIDLILGLQWVYKFKDDYNIRIANLSVSSTEALSYLNSPIAAAVEQLWLNGVTVVVASGNSKTNPEAVNYPPANDPFVITVGSVNGHEIPNPKKAVLSTWSRHGVTSEGIPKPDVTAPGEHTISLLAGHEAILALEHPDAVIGNYLEMSGTSVAAPVVTGIVALMLEANPSLTPNQIKAILTHTTVPYLQMPDQAGIVDAKRAIELAQDTEALAALVPVGYNQYPLSEFIGDSGNTVDYSKASWGNLDWLKASWGNMDWTKASWAL